MNVSAVWNAIEDARLALEDAQRQLTAEKTPSWSHWLTAAEMKILPDDWLIRDCGVYVYRDPSVKRSDPNSIVYVGNGKEDRPWQPHNRVTQDVDIEVLIDGLDGKTAEAIEYYLIKKYNPKYNLIKSEPGVIPQPGCVGPWRICAFQRCVQVGDTKLRITDIKNAEALYHCSYSNYYANGGSPFPNLEAGVDYDSVRIRIG